jgi:hypothetical protein
VRKDSVVTLIYAWFGRKKFKSLFILFLFIAANWSRLLF